MTTDSFFQPYDLAALVVFAAVVVGYTVLTDHSPLRHRTISAAMNRQRKSWMREALGRDLRMLDTGILQIMVSGMSIFASTSIVVIGGLIAGIAYNAELAREFSTVPMVGDNTPEAWSVKLGLLLLIFVYAFFKFAWSIRLAHYSAILVGALPQGDAARSDTAIRHAEAAARMSSLCGHHFNRGLRSNFFAVAAMGWMFGPWPFLAATVFVTLVLARREFGSNARKAVLSLP
ncbi:MAG: DUF599 domain-containing protein [Alphaproteobacteria bacterium]|nr:MAG: DUF599 domain-containing protein [Alphaproteobacteria bacterium]